MPSNTQIIISIIMWWCGAFASHWLLWKTVVYQALYLTIVLCYSCPNVVSMVIICLEYEPIDENSSTPFWFQAAEEALKTLKSTSDPQIKKYLRPVRCNGWSPSPSELRNQMSSVFKKVNVRTAAHFAVPAVWLSRSAVSFLWVRLTSHLEPMICAKLQAHVLFWKGWVWRW